MKLNPSKCAFGVSSGKFLGYMVSSRGIEANPEKIRAVLEIAIPENNEAATAADRTASSVEQVHLPLYR
jgi:hypothetical protein